MNKMITSIFFFQNTTILANRRNFIFRKQTQFLALSANDALSSDSMSCIRVSVSISINLSQSIILTIVMQTARFWYVKKKLLSQDKPTYVFYTDSNSDRFIMEISCIQYSLLSVIHRLRDTGSAHTSCEPQ